MIILGIDYGDARTGISICDINETLASPLKVIKARNVDKLIDEIGLICREKSPDLIVIGLPKNMDGSIGFRGEKCLLFREKLENTLNIKCEMIDERLTTVIAHGFLNETNTRGIKRKEVIDEVASTVILQDYLDRKNRGEK